MDQAFDHVVLKKFLTVYNKQFKKKSFQGFNIQKEIWEQLLHEMQENGHVRKTYNVIFAPAGSTYITELSTIH